MKYAEFKESLPADSVLAQQKISHATWLRLCFFERQLLWSRQLTTSMVCSSFDVSINLVQREITRYKEIYKSIAGKSPFKPYDPKLKYHRPSEDYSPIFLTDDTYHWDHLENYDKIDTSLASEMPMLTRRHSLKKLAIVLSAIDNTQSIRVNIASMTSPKGRIRLITPIGVACVHNRVHVRAYCWDNLDYRDFLIGRFITTPKVVHPKLGVEWSDKAPHFERFNGVPQEDDDKWNTLVTLSVTPNPNLSKDQQVLIASDYNLGSLDNLLQVKLRQSLVQYFLIDNRIPGTKTEFDAAKETPKVWPVLAFEAGTKKPAHMLGF